MSNPATLAEKARTAKAKSDFAVNEWWAHRASHFLGVTIPPQSIVRKSKYEAAFELEGNIFLMKFAWAGPGGDGSYQLQRLSSENIRLCGDRKWKIYLVQGRKKKRLKEFHDLAELLDSESSGS